MTNSNATFTISDIIAALPANARAQIIDSTHAKIRTDDETAEVWWDTSDPDNCGWAVRVVTYSRETDPVDGLRYPCREDSGSLDSADEIAAWF